MQPEPTLNDWLDALAAKQPTPGGGAVAALSAAVAAALIGMVSIYTTGPKWQDRETDMQRINGEASRLRQAALALMQADAEAFAKVGAAYALPHASDTEKTARTAAIQVALVAAAEPPSHVVDVAIELLGLTEELAPQGNPNVISDVAVAASNLHSALEAAIVNIAINQQSILAVTVKNRLQTTIDNATEAIKRTDAITIDVFKGLVS